MKKEKKQLNYNLMSCVFIYVWAVVFFIASLSIEDQASRTFPQVLCGLAVLLATVFLVSILTGKYKDDNECCFAGTARAMGMGGILILYIIANYLAGFYISTLLYLPAGMLYLGQRSWKVIAGVTVGLPLIVFIFFDLILGMQMPVGILFGI